MFISAKMAKVELFYRVYIFFASVILLVITHNS